MDAIHEMTEDARKREMRRMGDTESSIAYWSTRQVLWNGQPVTLREPARDWVSGDED